MLVPQDCQHLTRQELTILTEHNAGEQAGFPDEAYHQAGVQLTDRQTILRQADLLLSLEPPPPQELAKCKAGACIITLPFIAWHPEYAREVAQHNLSLVALDAIPRITRAQSMDVLSSQATVAGYAAIVLAAERIPVLMPMLSTAAGTVRPVEVVVIGAGVAGLQAIATARRLGARVYAFDVRAATREQVESVGGQFIEVEGARQEERGGYAVEQTEEFLRRQREVIAQYAARAYILFTTAAVPGKRAPLLIPEETVRQMPVGAVLVDMAARFGGNCALTKDGEEILWEGRRIIGDSNLAARFPGTASQLLSRNIANLLPLLIRDGKIQPQIDDEIIHESLIVFQGEIRSARVREHLNTT